jgi:hypothetical protein
MLRVARDFTFSCRLKLHTFRIVAKEMVLFEIAVNVVVEMIRDRKLICCIQFIAS